MKLRSLSELENLLPSAEKKEPNLQTSKSKHDGKGQSVQLIYETKGRKGKAVTIIKGLHHNPDTLNDIARILKKYCGAGGTVKNMDIEIQGDQRARLPEKLREMNYMVK